MLETIPDIPLPPYSNDTKAKGWRFELEPDRIRQSDTWALAKPEIKPWLLMLWMVAWEQIPCGSLSDDDELIAAKIGMSDELFQNNRKTLMRGWWKASDGRLYHPTVTVRVLSMIETKQKEKDRKAKFREKMSHGTTTGQPRDSTGTTTGQHRDSTGTTTGRTALELELELELV